jgi:hypothetical protein
MFVDHNRITPCAVVLSEAGGYTLSEHHYTRDTAPGLDGIAQPPDRLVFLTKVERNYFSHLEPRRVGLSSGNVMGEKQE